MAGIAILTIHLTSKVQYLRTACRTDIRKKGVFHTFEKSRVTCKRCKDTDEYKG